MREGMTTSRCEMICRDRCHVLSAGTRLLPRLLLTAVVVLSAIRKSESQQRHTSASSSSGGTMMADQSLLDLYVVEGLPAGTSIGSIPGDMGFSQKYSPVEMAELRYSLLSKPVVGSEVGPSSLSGLSSSSSLNFDRPLFAVDELHGTINTADRLDREILCRRLAEQTSSLTAPLPPCIIRFDVAIRPMTHFRIIRVRVEILDINDNEPTFPVGSIVLALPETATPGTSLHLPVAVDADSGVNGVRQYTLETASDAFKLVERSRNDIRLVVTSPLDRELMSEYRLIVVAVDGGEPVRSGTLQIDVTVVDSNDNAPRFTIFNSSYSSEVSEDAAPGTVLLVVSATDPDSGPNAQISYSLAPDRSSPRDLADLFAIGETSGELYTLAPLDRETESVYRMYVIASDRPETEVALSSIASVEIRVTDINDHSPHIRINSPSVSMETYDELAKRRNIPPSESINVTFAIRPDSPIGTFICHVTVEDLDMGENGRFACRLHGPSAAKFQLHRMYQTDFKVVTSSLLSGTRMSLGDGNGHEANNYDFTIVCRDFGSPAALTSTLPVSVKLVSSAEIHSAPLTCARNPYHVTVDESNDIGLAIVQPETLVVQTGSELKYRLDDEGVTKGVGDLVAVNSLSGLVTTRVPLDRERRVSFRFSVIVTDGISRTVTCHVHVTISDINDNRPQFFFPVPGNDTAIFRVGSSTTEVARVVATDADAPGQNSDVIYSVSLLSSPKMEHDYGAVPEFTIDSRSGVVKFISGDSTPLSYRKQYDVKVIASDRGSPALIAEAVLKILFITDPEELSGQQRRSTSGTFGTSGEHGSQILALFLIGSLVIVLVAVVIIVVVLVVATADRRRRDAISCGKKPSLHENTKQLSPVPMSTDKRPGHDGDVIGHPPSMTSTSILHSSLRNTANCDNQNAATPTKKVVIFVKDVMTPPATDSDRQMAPPSHATLSSADGTPRSPDSDDSGRGRSSEDGTGVDASHVTTGRHHHGSRLVTSAGVDAMRDNGEKSPVRSRPSAETVIVNVSNSYPSISTMPSLSVGSHLNVPNCARSADEWAHKHRQHLHDAHYQQPPTEGGIASNSLGGRSNDSRRYFRVDYSNSLRRTPSLSSSMALSAVDYRSWLTDSELDGRSDLTVVTSSSGSDVVRTIGGRFRSGSVSRIHSADSYQQYNQHQHQLTQQRVGGASTSFGRRGIDVVAMRPFSTLFSRGGGGSGSAADDRRGVFVDRAADSSSSLPAASCYTLPQRRRRELIWPVASAPEASSGPTSDASQLTSPPTDQIEQVSTAVGGPRVIHRHTPGLKCIISGDGSVVYRSSAAPPAEWMQTKTRPTLSPSGECDTNLSKATFVRQRPNDNDGNKSTVVGKLLASSVDTIV